MKRYFRTAYWVILAVAISGIALNINFLNRKGYGHLLQAYAATKANRVVPHTIVLIERTESTTGSVILHRSLRAVRSDGAEYSEEQVLGSDGSAIVDSQKILILPSRLSLFIHDASRLKSTWRATLVERATYWSAKLDPTTNCLTTLGGVDLREQNEQDLGLDYVDGIKAIKVAANVGKMTSVLKMWLAPSLGCELVKQTVEIRGDHREFIGTSTKSLVQLDQGEPDPALFVVPDNYVDAPPSELNLAVSAKLNGAPVVCNPAMREAMDKKYWSHRP